MQLTTMLKKMRNYLIAGIIIVLPIIVSIYVISFLFVKATDYVFHIFPGIYVDQFQLKLVFRIIGLGFLITGLIMVGMFGRNVVGRKLIKFGEGVVAKIPLLGSIYTAVKQVSEAFLGYDKTVLNKVCMVEFPRAGIHSIGFITSTVQGEAHYKTGKKNIINVFVPTTPNPTTGFLLLLPESDVTVLDMSIEDGLKLVISGGAVNPPYMPDEKNAETKEVFSNNKNNRKHLNV